MAVTVMWLAVGAAGALGAVARYLVDHLVSARASGAFPWGTFAVNASGSFVAGAVAALLAVEVVGSDVAVIVAGGFLGAYTTFSTAMYETVRLIEDGARRLAIGNLLVPLLGSVLAAAGGWTLAAALVGR
jgi:CrcB protein